MFFRTQSRINPETGKHSIYYRLVENYRDVMGDVRQRAILSVGFMEDVTPEELLAIADGLNARYAAQMSLFPENVKVQDYIEKFWRRLVSEKKLDVVRDMHRKEAQKDWQTIDTSSIESKDVRELGGEWLCLQTLRRLEVDVFLRRHDFNEQECALALSHIVSRTIYPASELKTVAFMQENSSICELTGLDTQKIVFGKICFGKSSLP